MRLNLPVLPNLELGTSEVRGHTASTLIGSPAELGTDVTVAALLHTGAQIKRLQRRLAGQKHLHTI